MWCLSSHGADDGAQVELKVGAAKDLTVTDRKNRTITVPAKGLSWLEVRIIKKATCICSFKSFQFISLHAFVTSHWYSPWLCISGNNGSVMLAHYKTLTLSVHSGAFYCPSKVLKNCLTYHQAKIILNVLSQELSQRKSIIAYFCLDEGLPPKHKCYSLERPFICPLCCTCKILNDGQVLPALLFVKLKESRGHVSSNGISQRTGSLNSRRHTWPLSKNTRWLRQMANYIP